MINNSTLISKLTNYPSNYCTQRKLHRYGVGKLGPFEWIPTLHLYVWIFKDKLKSGHFGFFHQWSWPPRYNWNIVESYIEHHNPNSNPILLAWNYLVPRLTKEKGQTIQWPKKKGHDTKGVIRHNIFKCWLLTKMVVIVLSVLFLWSLYCLSFFFGHCIVCPFSLVIVLSVLFVWSLYCLSFFFKCWLLTKMDKQCCMEYRNLNGTWSRD
jgi:hypothetical protein